MKTILYFLYSWLGISSIVIAFIFFQEPTTDAAVIGLKDLPFYSFLIASALFGFNRLSSVFSLYFLYFSLYLVFMFIVSPADFFVKLAASRQLLSFFVFVCVGYLVTLTLDSKSLYYKFVGIFSFVAAIFGLLDVYFEFLGDGFLVPYFSAKNIGVFDSGYPFIFVEPAPDFVYSILGVENFLRVSSIFLDPINFGHFLAFILFSVCVMKGSVVDRSYRYFYIFILLFCLVLTISKGAWLQLCLSFAFYYYRGNGRVIFIISILVFSLLFVLAGFIPGVAVHLDGTVSAFESISFFGHGLGSVGNYSSMFGNSLDLGIGDSFLGLLMGQLGVVGVFLWGASVYFILNKLPQDSFLRYALFAQLFVGLISENAFNLLSIFTIAIAIGVEIKCASIRPCLVEQDLKGI